MKPGTVLAARFRITGGWNGHRAITLQQGELVVVLSWAHGALLTGQGEQAEWLYRVKSTDFVVVWEP